MTVEELIDKLSEHPMEADVVDMFTGLPISYCGFNESSNNVELDFE